MCVSVKNSTCRGHGCIVHGRTSRLSLWPWELMSQALQHACVATGLKDGASAEDKVFYEGKLATCKYYFNHHLPATAVQADLLKRYEKREYREIEYQESIEREREYR